MILAANATTDAIGSSTATANTFRLATRREHHGRSKPTIYTQDTDQFPPGITWL
jgi:hypothetical protein